MSKEHNVNKSQDGSAYWHYVFNKPSYYAGDGSIRENVEANPDQLSEEDTIIKKSLLSDEEEENLAAYYKMVSGGVLKKLAPRQREIWKMRFFRWCSEEEIGSKLGISIKSVRTHLVRAAAKIKAEFERQQQKRAMLKGDYFNAGFKKKIETKGEASTDREFGDRLLKSEKEIAAFCKKHPELRRDA